MEKVENEYRARLVAEQIRTAAAAVPTYARAGAQPLIECVASMAVLLIEQGRQLDALQK